MSGFNEQDTISRLVSEGLAGFLQQPFRLQDMSERIQTAIADAKASPVRRIVRKFRSVDSTSVVIANSPAEVSSWQTPRSPT
jgi:hypothetical protein